MVNIKDVAKKAGVSKTTVSHALSGKRLVNRETKKKIFKVIKELNYKPNIIAQSLKTKKSKIVALSFAIGKRHLSEQVWLEMIAGIGESISKLQYKLLLVTVGDNENNEILELINNNYVEGIILAECKYIKDERVELLKKNKSPFVVIGKVKDTRDISYVDIDLYSAAFNSVEHLILQGHTKIAFILAMSGYSYTEREIKGFTNAYKKNGLALNRKFLISCDGSEGGSYKATQNLLRSFPSFSSIIACSDTMAVGVLRAIKEIGLRVPQDISLISLSNSVLSLISSPKLTSIDLNMYRLGENAAEMLVRLIKNKNMEKQKLVLPVKLVKRESTKKLI